MELVERYIYEVGRHLPRNKRADVQAELRSLIQDSLDARTEGGEPTEAMIIAALKELGAPREVAGSYAPSHQMLIGPTLFPTFLMVVQFALLGLGIAQVVGLVFSLPETVNPGAAFLEAFGRFIGSAWSVFGTVVFIFALLERFEVQVEQPEKEWDPRTLPQLPAGQEVNRGEIAFELAASLVGLWVLHFWGDALGLRLEELPDVRPFWLDPAVRPYVLWGSFLLFADAMLGVYLLYSGRWTLPVRTMTVAINLMWIALLVFASNLDWPSIMGTDWAVVSMRISLAVAMIIITIDTISHIYRQARSILNPPPAHNGVHPAPAR